MLSCFNDDLDKPVSTLWCTTVVSSIWHNKNTVPLIVKFWASLSCNVIGKHISMLRSSSSILTRSRLHISLHSLTCHQGSYGGRNTCPTLSHGIAFSTPNGVRMLYQIACHGDRTCLHVCLDQLLHMIAPRQPSSNVSLPG